MPDGQKLSQPALAVVIQPSVSAQAALAVAQAALEAGRSRGEEDLAVAVVDRAGTPLVVLRTDFGTAQFVEGALAKAWTAVNFRASTRHLCEEIEKGSEDFRQLPHVEKALFLMGGVPLKQGKRVVGAIGVAGAASGIADDEMAEEAARFFRHMVGK